MKLLALLVVAVGLVGTRAISAEDSWPRPASAVHPTPESEKLATELGIGHWIWTTNFAEKQQCRFWRAFMLPATNAVRKANLRITADNQYRLLLDGREIGQGANWKTLTDYDITWLLTPGTHLLGVDAFNDGREGGVILGLRLEFADGQQDMIVSDRSWWVVPEEERNWLRRSHPDRRWMAACEVGAVGQEPWWKQPLSISKPAPLRPIEVRFWQSGWFLAGILTICAVTLAMSLRLAAKLTVQNRARRLLELERARIARDIHDDLGSALTQLVLQGEVALTEFPEGSAARSHFGLLAERARGVSQALDEVVWAVNSKRDTLRDFTSYLCKSAQSFLDSTPIRCRLDVQPELPAMSFDLPVRRGLFLAVKEALNNAAKHSQATELFLRIHLENEKVRVTVEDNGLGFDVATLGGDRNGLTNMQQRMSDLGGEFHLHSEPGAGCRVEFLMPVAQAPGKRASIWSRLFRHPAQHGTPPPHDA